MTEKAENEDSSTNPEAPAQDAVSPSSTQSPATRKRELEIKKLEHELSVFGVWSKRLTVLVAAATGFVALFAAIHQLSNATSESRLNRLSDEKSYIAESFDLLWSTNNKDVALGTLGLIQYVDSSEHRANICAALKTRLAILQPSPLRGDMMTRTEQRHHEFAQIQGMVPLIEKFNDAERKELYTIILHNEALKYGRLVALKKLGSVKADWERALADDDDEYVEATIFAISEIRPPFAEELLIDVLRRPYDFIVTVAAANALSRLGAKSAVNELVLLLQSPNSYIRSSVAQALGVIGDPSAVDALQAAYRREGEEEEVRGEVRLALKKLGMDVNE